MSRIQSMRLDFEGLIQAMLLTSYPLGGGFDKVLSRVAHWRQCRLSHILGSACLQLHKKDVSYLSLQGDILIKEFILVAKVPSDNFPVHPNVRQNLATLFENQFKLLCSEAPILKRLEWGVAAEHTEVQVLPLLAYTSKFCLTLFHREVLEDDFKNGILDSAPSKNLLGVGHTYHSLVLDMTLK